MTRLMEELLTTRRLAWEKNLLDAVGAIDALVEVVRVAQLARSCVDGVQRDG